MLGFLSSCRGLLLSLDRRFFRFLFFLLLLSECFSLLSGFLRLLGLFLESDLLFSLLLLLLLLLLVVLDVLLVAFHRLVVLLSDLLSLFSSLIVSSLLIWRPILLPSCLCILRYLFLCFFIIRFLLPFLLPLPLLELRSLLGGLLVSLLLRGLRPFLLDPGGFSGLFLVKLELVEDSVLRKLLCGHTLRILSDLSGH